MTTLGSDEDQLMPGAEVKSWTEPSLNSPVAVNWKGTPCPRVGFAGVTESFEMVAADTVRLAGLLAMPPEVAVILHAPAVVFAMATPLAIEVRRLLVEHLPELEAVRSWVLPSL